MSNTLSPTAKQAKAQRIAQVAWQLFEQQAFTDISMAQIARQAGVAKGTLFNYYPTKESLFMTLLLVGYQRYFATLNADLAKGPVLTPTQLKARLLAETRALITDHATLVRLNALRGPVLEGHADREQTRQGRQDLYAANLALGQTVAAKVPALSVATASHLFVSQSAIISGLMNLAGLERFNHTSLATNFPIFQIDLETEACQTFGYYLDGILEEELHANSKRS